MGEVKIGIFDSGVGGFSVLKKIREVSSADIVYYGDTARAPYGNREDSEIISFIKDDIAFLKEKGVTHLVNACNSMSVVTTKELKEELGLLEHYTDMIDAFANHSIFCNGERILVIGTVATIRNGSYEEILKNKGVPVASLAMPHLASHIEQESGREILLEETKTAIIAAKEHGASHILFGCTHYPLISHIFYEAQEMLSWGGEFIDPSIYIAGVVESWQLKGHKQTEYYASKNTEVFLEYSNK